MRLAGKWICILFSALILMGALCGCSQGGEEKDEKLTVTACVCAQVASLDPAANTDPAAESLFYAFCENLLRSTADENGRIRTEPGMAREYQVVENYDGTVEYIFTLRSTARWSDGTRVKAKDFAYAWRRLIDPAADLPNHALLSMVKGYDEARSSGDLTQLGIRADGDTGFRVTLSEPCPWFLSDVCTAVATMPLRADVVTENSNWAADAGFPCNGPYEVAVWQKTSSVRLSRNSNYYDRRSVGPEVLRFRFAADGQDAWRMYQAGNTDYIEQPPGGAEGTLSVPIRSTCCVLYNHMSDTFSDQRVRAAFDAVLDRAAIAEAAGAEAAVGLVPWGIPDVSEDSEQDFRSAAGAPMPPEGDAAQRRAQAESLLRSCGEPVPELKCIYSIDDGAGPTAAAVTAIWRGALNVAVTAEALTREEFDLRIAEGEFDLAIDILRPFGGDAFAWLELFAGTDGGNMLHYVNKPYDLLIGVAATARDQAARLACLHDAEELLLEDVALSPLWYGVKTCLLREAYTGVRHDSRGNACFTSVLYSERKK